MSNSKVSLSRDDVKVNSSEVAPTVLSLKKIDYETLKLPSIPEDEKISTRRQSLSERTSAVVKNIRRQSIAVTLSFWASFRGLFFNLLASLCFAFIGVLVKYTDDVDASFVSLIRFVEMGILGIASVSSLTDQPIFGTRNVWIWLILRGITGASANYFRFLTIQLLPLANAMVLLLTVPVFTTIFARIFFKEPCGLFHVIALVVALIGISLTAKLDAFFGLDHQHDVPISNSHILGLFCGLGAALCQTTEALILRHLKNVHFAVILFTSSWVAVMELFVICYFSSALHVPERGTAVFIIMGVGVFGFFGQLLFTKAISIEEAGLISMTGSSMDLFLAFLFQITIFRVIPDTCTVIGSLMVFSSVLLISLRKYLVTLTHDHPMRRYLGFILR
ncbi:solute carrier family 35 member G1-like [Brevipalpus obovatus]|uniref:solute carrier family 35 member G1-like n=1 Tax=Brevipalpus obovatus TaxID=246614 RepID=UPI003D9DB78C